MKKKQKTIQFKDLTEEYIQIVESKQYGVCNVLRFDETFIHNHRTVRLIELNATYKINLRQLELTAEEFNNAGFIEIYKADKKQP